MQRTGPPAPPRLALAVGFDRARVRRLRGPGEEQLSLELREQQRRVERRACGTASVPPTASRKGI